MSQTFKSDTNEVAEPKQYMFAVTDSDWEWQTSGKRDPDAPAIVLAATPALAAEAAVKLWQVTDPHPFDQAELKIARMDTLGLIDVTVGELDELTFGEYRPFSPFSNLNFTMTFNEDEQASTSEFLKKWSDFLKTEQEKYSGYTNIGEVIREEYMKPLDLSNATLAYLLGMTEYDTAEFIEKGNPFDETLAKRLGELFHSSQQFWVNLHTNLSKKEA